MHYQTQCKEIKRKVVCEWPKGHFKQKLSRLLGREGDPGIVMISKLFSTHFFYCIFQILAKPRMEPSQAEWLR